MRIRSIWHVVLGIILPWLDLGANIGGMIGFCAYQYLQYKYRSNRQERYKDDSYLDVNELLVAYVISAIVHFSLSTVGILKW